MQYNILIVEDEADISGLLVNILKEAGFGTIQAYSGTEAKLLLENHIPDLILLDLMLPGMPGEELLWYIREEKQYSMPILILSAKTAVSHKVDLLKNGADDYITKPFEPEEVTARVEASLRRVGKGAIPEQSLTHKKLTLCPQSRKAVMGETELVLTAHEYDILLLLIKNPGKVYSRESLYELVWQGGYYGENNTVNVHVSNIRKKLKEHDPDQEYIKTVYGIGFKLS